MSSVVSLSQGSASMCCDMSGAGGTIWPLEALEAAARAAHEVGLAVHLDGARLWNASVASGVPL
ncbi:MAG: beta-eliminating lyase-related protein, partial [Ilumatobacteraceae bacterium]